MRAILRIAATTTAAGLLLASAATMASASTASPHPAATHAARVHLTSGETSLTTVSGLAETLLVDSHVALFATTPGTETLLGSTSDPQIKFSFPVTGGRVNPARLTGTIRHRGGILFVNTSSGDRIKLSRFRISLTSKRLSAIVSTVGMRVTVAKLSFSHARFSIGRSHVKVRRIGVHLTTAAATALNDVLGTSLHHGPEDRDRADAGAVLGTTARPSAGLIRRTGAGPVPRTGAGRPAGRPGATRPRPWPGRTGRRTAGRRRRPPLAGRRACPAPRCGRIPSPGSGPHRGWWTAGAR